MPCFQNPTKVLSATRIIVEYLISYLTHVEIGSPTKIRRENTVESHTQVEIGSPTKIKKEKLAEPPSYEGLFFPLKNASSLLISFL